MATVYQAAITACGIVKIKHTGPFPIRRTRYQTELASGATCSIDTQCRTGIFESADHQIWMGHEELLRNRLKEFVLKYAQSR